MSENRTPALTGGCQCGAVRYALYAVPPEPSICHCRMCIPLVGGPGRGRWGNVWGNAAELGHS